MAAPQSAHLLSATPRGAVCPLDRDAHRVESTHASVPVAPHRRLDSGSVAIGRLRSSTPTTPSLSGRPRAPTCPASLCTSGRSSRRGSRHRCGSAWRPWTRSRPSRPFAHSCRPPRSPRCTVGHARCEERCPPSPPLPARLVCAGRLLDAPLPSSEVRKLTRASATAGAMRRRRCPPRSRRRSVSMARLRRTRASAACMTSTKPPRLPERCEANGDGHEGSAARVRTSTPANRGRVRIVCALSLTQGATRGASCAPCAA